MNPGITLTGADVFTPMPDLVALADRGAEIGLLISLTNLGRRYPSLRWAADIIGTLGTRCAVHLCGKVARQSFLAGRMEWAAGVGRVQINGEVSEEEVRQALGLASEVVVQFRPEDAGRRVLALPRLSYLVDGSGGRGVSPEAWFRPGTSRPVGFAGGLGPDNLATELPRIAAVARDPWWVDTESKLRNERDVFSVELAHRAIDIFQAFAQEPQP